MLKHFGYDEKLDLMDAYSEVQLKSMKVFNFLQLKPRFARFLNSLFILFSGEKKYINKQDFFQIFYPVKGSNHQTLFSSICWKIITFPIDPTSKCVQISSNYCSRKPYKPSLQPQLQKGLHSIQIDWIQGTHPGDDRYNG